MPEGASRRLLRTIRFDASDDRVFVRTAAADEWAVSGAFEFAHLEAEPAGKPGQALRSGFLGTASFGRSTFVTAAPIDEDEREEVVSRLAGYLTREYGAPSSAAAHEAAEAEVAFAEELADHPPGTLIAVRRSLGEDGVVERFRTIERGQRPHARIWTLVPEDDDG